MIEIRLHGRGRQGSVTAAKILAIAAAKEGKQGQAFPRFGVERQGAPIEAYFRIDDKPIRIAYQIYEPDHVVVLDSTLIASENVTQGLKEGGWIIINSATLPEEFDFPGYRIATVDAAVIALEYGLNTNIVNTILLGGIAKVLGIVELESILGAMEKTKEIPADKLKKNKLAAKEAFKRVRMSEKTVEKITTLPPEAPKKLEIPMISISYPAPGPKTGSWRTIRPIQKNSIPPCVNSCLAGNDVQKCLSLVEKGEFKKAWETLIETNPLPAVCGSVCPRPCESSCNRGQFDESLAIRDLEGFLGELALENNWRPKKTACQIKPPRIAVIGSGPAGLSFAYQLARRDYEVTIFEKSAVLGGLLRLGIPDYRLPKDLLEREMENNIFEPFGVEKRVMTSIDKESFRELKKEFQAIFVAVGAHKDRKLNIPGEDLKDVISGLDFLEKVNLNQKPRIGKRVAVIGGGNAAIDAARVAKSLNSQVFLIYRRTQEDMPAFKEEIAAAKKEGIEFHFLAKPTEIAFLPSGEKRLECIKGKVQGKDEKGRNNVFFPENGLTLQILVNSVIVAIGEEPDLSFIEEDFDCLGGDALTGAGTAAAAIQSGREAARKIYHRLNGIWLKEFPPPGAEIVYLDDLNLNYFKNFPRELQINDGQSAIKEAERCFSCGACDLCGNCWKFCPDGAVFKKNNKYQFNLDYCKGCLVCKNECPTGFIGTEMEEK